MPWLRASRPVTPMTTSATSTAPMPVRVRAHRRHGTVHVPITVRRGADELDHALLREARHVRPLELVNHPVRHLAPDYRPDFPQGFHGQASPVLMDSRAIGSRSASRSGASGRRRTCHPRHSR